MMVARQVFQAKYGRGDELVALFKELNARLQEGGEAGVSFRILTDASGPFLPSSPKPRWRTWPPGGGLPGGDEPALDGGWFGRMMPLVESGSREFYNVVE